MQIPSATKPTAIISCAIISFYCKYKNPSHQSSDTRALIFLHFFPFRGKSLITFPPSTDAVSRLHFAWSRCRLHFAWSRCRLHFAWPRCRLHFAWPRFRLHFAWLRCRLQVAYPRCRLQFAWSRCRLHFVRFFLYRRTCVVSLIFYSI